MKFAVLALSLLLPLGAFAAGTTDKKIVNAFLGAAEVKEKVKELKATHQAEKESKVDVVSIGGGCGFAGCNGSFIVVQRLSTSGSNTQTFAVVGIVSDPSVGEPKFEKLIDVD